MKETYLCLEKKKALSQKSGVNVFYKIHPRQTLYEYFALENAEMRKTIQKRPSKKALHERELPYLFGFMKYNRIHIGENVVNLVH